MLAGLAIVTAAAESRGIACNVCRPLGLCRPRRDAYGEFQCRDQETHQGAVAGMVWFFARVFIGGPFWSNGGEGIGNRSARPGNHTFWYIPATHGGRCRRVPVGPN